MPVKPYTVNTQINEVITDPAFGDYGRLIFPVDSGYYSGDALGDLGLVWYNYIDPDKTVEICNYMKEQAAAGNQIFYDIYTADEKAADHAKEDTDCYSLWGGSTGARMAAYLGSYGTAAFGEYDYPQPGAVIMQYTGHSEVLGTEPPTYACVGTNDWIASYSTVERRIERIKRNGTDAEIEVFDGLPHGFGLGTGTVAEGWLDRAVEFWEGQEK